jgi:hypothetical protein
VELKTVSRKSVLTEQALEALDAHLRHWEAIGSMQHRSATLRFLEVYNSETRRRAQMGHRFTKDAIEQWTRSEEAIWNYAPTIVLDPAVHQFVTDASAFMPAAPLLAEVVPSPAGVVMMPGFKRIIDYSSQVDYEAYGLDHEVPCVAIGWRMIPEVQNLDGELVPGLDLFIYSSKQWAAQVGDSPAWLTEWPSQFVTIDRTPWAFGVPWREPRDEAEVIARLEVGPDGNKQYVEATYHDEGVVVSDTHVARVRRFLLALWSFMADEIVAPTKVDLPRSNMKRLDRSGRMMAEVPEDGALRIIHLRRYADDGEERGEYDPDAEAPMWSHRWYVRPHWRRLASGRVTYVKGHIKGPEDRPLVLKNNIVAVRR